MTVSDWDSVNQAADVQKDISNKLDGPRRECIPGGKENTSLQQKDHECE